MSANPEDLKGSYERSVANAKAGHPALDYDRLAEFIASQDAIEGPVVLSGFSTPQASGSSNGILLFTAEYGAPDARQSRDLVARYAPGATMIRQKSFSDEYLTLKVAYAASLPVPEPLWLDEDGAIVGYPAFIMSRIDGDPPAAAMYSKGPLAEADAPTRNEMMLQAAGFHGRLRATSIGADQLPHLSARGDGETAVERELNWYLKEATLSSDGDEPKLDVIRRIHGWMVKQQPEVRPGTLVQGDSQIANVIYRDGQLAGVLDWELAYLGHGEADLALIVFLTESLKQLDRYVEGTPTEADYIARFEAEAGAPVEHLAYFKLVPLFKTLCVLLSARSFQDAFEPTWSYYLDRMEEELSRAQLIYGE